MKFKFISLLIILSILIIFFIIKRKHAFKDACFCTEILSSENFIKQKDKMPSVRRCLNFYKNFENAHRDCVKSIQINPTITKKDSLKSI